MLQKIIILLIIQLNFLYKFEEPLSPLNINKSNFEINNDNHIFSFSFIDQDNSFNINEIYFKLSNVSYNLSLRFNIIQVEYFITFYYKNNSLIIPSDLSLIYDLHLICHINNIEYNLNIDSLAFIYLDKCFKCIEYVNVNEKINFGIIIYKQENETSCINFTQFFFNESVFNNNKYSYKKNKFFYPLFIEKEFYLKNKNISLSLKKLYIQKPKYNTKFNILLEKDKWDFFNIYNHYFCFCVGLNCLYNNLLNYKNKTQICKYKFYLNLIEENKYLYNKTYYLLGDFPGDFQSIDDAYPVFQKLIS